MTTMFNDYSGLVVSPEFLDGNISIGLDCAQDAMDEYRKVDESSYVTCWLRNMALQTPRNMSYV